MVVMRKIARRSRTSRGAQEIDRHAGSIGDARRHPFVELRSVKEKSTSG
jgi:hypothetical protein